MCAVNDAKRMEYDTKINELKIELNNEKNKLDDLRQAKYEIQQIIDSAQCAIDNLENCDFGGDKILSSIITSQRGYEERQDYYDEYYKLCSDAIEVITEELDQTIAIRDSIPINCGSCEECNPPTLSGLSNALL